MTDIKITPSPYGTWEYIPAGGMALTAKQVEDVRTLVNNSPMEIYDAKERGLYYAAAARLRALFPATEPAEEETKADLCAVRLCVLPAEHSGVHADREGLRWNNPTSSPVVPAPTETGPWETVEAIPKGVMVVTDRDKRTWKYSSRTDGWMHRSHGATHWVHGYPDACFAPFVAAEEG